MENTQDLANAINNLTNAIRDFMNVHTQLVTATQTSSTNLAALAPAMTDALSPIATVATQLTTASPAVAAATPTI